MNLGEAIKLATLAGATSEHLTAEEVTAIAVLVKELGTRHEALAFYANPANYLDDDPGRYTEGGVFVPDSGHTARMALKLDDISGDILTPLEVESIQNERKLAA